MTLMATLLIVPMVYSLIQPVHSSLIKYIPEKRSIFSITITVFIHESFAK